ncbi:transposase [Streptomyces sp. TRM 70361]|nr:transposase [Streptomyces sp. TRM 70361]MEE1941077.1 transposase [Streptomyces sp. TRM 70361]
MTTGVCRGTTTPRPSRSGPWTAVSSTCGSPVPPARSNSLPSPARARRTWSGGTGSCSWPPPSTSASRRCTSRRGSSGWTGASPTSPPPATGTNTGRRPGRYRRWQARKRAELQAGQTRSAKQLLKKRARREARHAAHINHTIAKTVVAVAQRTERGIALEELRGIRERVTVPRDQRARQSAWPFHQLGAFLAYKAKRAGVPFLEVDPAHTSQRCPRCGHTERANRRARDHFSCRRCGLAGPADRVAGVNIAQRAATAWVFVNMPDPASA